MLKWIADNHGVVFREGDRERISLGDDVTDVVAGESLIDVVLTKALGISSATPSGRDAVAWLRAWIRENGRCIRRHSMSVSIADRIYLPSLEGLTKISPGRLEIVKQVENDDHVLVHHHPPFQFRLEDCTMEACREGLAAIEQAVVGAQSVSHPAMAWFIAINGLMCSVIRHTFAEKFLVVHQGPPQVGKTSGAQLLLTALGAGQVTGSASVAGLHAMESGLVVLDNLERRDWTTDLIKQMLHASTGGHRIRSTRTGRSLTTHLDALFHLTSVEGLPTPELRQRCVSVEYKQPVTYSSRSHSSQEVLSRQHAIHVAIVMTLQRHLAVGRRVQRTSGALSNFADHYGTTCSLMGHIGDLLGRPEAWAEGIIRDWDTVLAERAQEDHGSDELEAAILGAVPRLGNHIPYTCEGVGGRLYITTAATMAAAIGDGSTANQLSRRLRGARFSEVQILFEERARDVRHLKRQGSIRPMGVFVPGQQIMETGPSVLQRVTPSRHRHLTSSDDSYYVWPYRGYMQNGHLLRAIKTPRDALLSDLQQAALNDAILLLRRLISHWRGMSCCVMPNSRGVPTHLETLMRESGLDCDSYRLHGIETIKGNKDVAPRDLQEHLYVEATGEREEPSHLLLVDDVITTGAHCRAASDAISCRFPSTAITGLFMFCATGGLSQAATSGE